MAISRASHCSAAFDSACRTACCLHHDAADVAAPAAAEQLLQKLQCLRPKSEVSLEGHSFAVGDFCVTLARVRSSQAVLGSYLEACPCPCKHLSPAIRLLLSAPPLPSAHGLPWHSASSKAVQATPDGTDRVVCAPRAGELPSWG